MTTQLDLDDAAAPHPLAVQQLAELRTALRQVAQAHAWLAFGECRSFGSGVPLMSPRDADAVARDALGLPTEPGIMPFGRVADAADGAHLERICSLVTAVRDANRDANKGNTFRLLTPGQERAWLDLLAEINVEPSGHQRPDTERKL